MKFEIQQPAISKLPVRQISQAGTDLMTILSKLYKTLLAVRQPDLESEINNVRYMRKNPPKPLKSRAESLPAAAAVKSANHCQANPRVTVYEGQRDHTRSVRLYEALLDTGLLPAG